MLKILNGLKTLAVALALGCASAPAAAAAVDEIIFFGDSLSDTGNVWFATGGFPPPPYFQGNSGGQPDFTGGQWSGPGGPSWPTLFASNFELPATPSLVPGGNNFAWGGARTGTNPDPFGVLWLAQQVELYALPFEQSGTSADVGTIVSIMIGGNDVANSLGDQAALEAGIADIVSQMTRLHNIGVRRFLVANVPDIGATPRFQAIDAAQPGVAAFATSWTLQWNSALATAIEDAELPGAVVNVFDFFAFSKDPELLAVFENTTDACLTEVFLCSDPASYFYWDSFHPSSTSHALLAGGILDSLVALRLQTLRDDVTGVGPGKSLASKIRKAQRSFSDFDLEKTCKALRGFRSLVRAQTGKKLAEDLAADLTAQADAVTASLRCS